MIKLPTICALLLLAVPACAHITHDQAFDLCTSQPALQKGELAPNVEFKLSRPHDPVLDTMTEAQIINATQWVEGNRCAAILQAHPDVFSAIAREQFASRDRFEMAWVAFNSYCKGDRVSAACITAELDAYFSIKSRNFATKDGRESPASRACTLAMGAQADFVEEIRCMDVIGTGDPGDPTTVYCGGGLGAVLFKHDKHDGENGKATGSRIAACFKKGAPQ